MKFNGLANLNILLLLTKISFNYKNKIKILILERSTLAALWVERKASGGEGCDGAVVWPVQI